jgi:RNA polymerase-associated protein CTR9
MVLIHWANHFLYRGDSEKVIALAREALENAKTTEMKAEAYYVLGRGYHSVDNYNEASTAYFRNTQLNDKYIPARFGMGQMYIQRGDLPKALTEFTHVLKIDNGKLEYSKLMC